MSPRKRRSRGHRRGRDRERAAKRRRSRETAPGHRGDRERRVGPDDDRRGRSVPFPVDVVDRGPELDVAAELPGLTTQDIEVRVRGDRLQIAVEPDEADRLSAGSGDGARFHRRERDRGSRSRTVTLPASVDERRSSASYLDGVLRIRLRKRAPSRRVDVE